MRRGDGAGGEEERGRLARGDTECLREGGGAVLSQAIRDIGAGDTDMTFHLWVVAIVGIVGVCFGFVLGAWWMVEEYNAH